MVVKFLKGLVLKTTIDSLVIYAGIGAALGLLIGIPVTNNLARLGETTLDYSLRALGFVCLGFLFGMFILYPLMLLVRWRTTLGKREWGIFVRVVDGKAVESGNPFWSWGVPPEEIHWISGPRNGGVCRVEGSVPYNITVEIQLRISLTAIFEGPFDLQQLWEMTRQHRSSLEVWLMDTYQEALKEAEPSFSPNLEGWGRIIWDLSELVKSAKAFDQMAFSNLRSVSAFPGAPRMPRGHMVVRNY